MSWQRIILIVIAMILCVDSRIFAAPTSLYPDLWKARPFYFGPLFGYGNTDWSMLVVNCNANDPNCNPSMLSASAPLSAGDDGWAWGATIGYEIKPSWALESMFIRFPNTNVLFNSGWNFYADQFNLTTMRSTTWALMLVAKFMTQIAETGFRGFANAGIDFTFRNDLITNAMRINPTFGVGLNYLFPRNLMLELSFQYVTGYGQCNEVPAVAYMPFLYSVNAKLLYRI